MKNIKKVVLMMSIFISMLFVVDNVYASSSSISVSTSSPTKGVPVTITVTVKNVNTVDLTATISGAGTNATIRLVDGSMTGDRRNYSASKTVTPTSTGTITVKISGDSNAVKDGAYVDVSGSKNISVIDAPSGNNSNGGSSNGNNSNSNNSNTNNGNSTNTEQDNNSKENNLSSLSVSTGTLSPAFSADKTTYKVDLTSDIEKISVTAKAKDSKATVSGTGEHELKVGENNIVITVKAENGSKKTYTVSVYVTEKPTQNVKMGDQQLGILNDLSKADLPKGFEKTTITIDEKEVTALKNETLGLTLLYLQNDDQSTGFYIYENNSVTRKYETITVNGKIYVILDAPADTKGLDQLKKGKVKIGDLEINSWSFEDEVHANFSIVYLMNDVGEKGLYSYESSEGTLQKYVPMESTENNTMMYVFIGTTVLFAVSTGVVAYLYMAFKKKSISAIKDYYDQKNQGE